MTPKKSVSEDERSVKNYQLDAVQKQLDQHEKIIPEINKKLSDILTIVQDRPTTAQVEDKIKVVQADYQRDLKDAIEKQDLKYGPVVVNNKRLLWAVVATGLSLMGSLILLGIGVVTKS